MATVKLKTTQSGGLAVVLKDGRVSCSCCDECCPYPALAFEDGFFGINDLPDTLIAYGQDGAYQITFTKAGEGDAVYVGDAQDTRIAITYIGGTPLWEAQSFDQGLGEWVGFQDTSPNPCLYFDPDTENAAYIGDNFQDTYSVSGPISETVTRENLCLWSSGGISLTNYRYKWTVNGNAKSGNQDGPVGSYAGGYSVS